MEVKLKQYIKEKLIKYANYLILGLTFVIAISLIRNIIRIRAVAEKIIEKEKEVAKLDQENLVLKEKVNYFQSEEYVEKEIRDKLGLAKEGETIVVLPDEEVLKKLIPKVAEEEETLPDPNWKKWLRLFL